MLLLDYPYPQSGNESAHSEPASQSSALPLSPTGLVSRSLSRRTAHEHALGKLRIRRAVEGMVEGEAGGLGLQSLRVPSSPGQAQQYPKAPPGLHPLPSPSHPGLGPSQQPRETCILTLSLQGEGKRLKKAKRLFQVHTAGSDFPAAGHMLSAPCMAQAAGPSPAGAR